MTRLARVSQEIDTYMDEYKFNEAASTCYQFVWHEFCDWYLEMAKLELYSEDQRRRQVAQSVIQVLLSGVVRLLHPFLPFITEEIWQRLPHTEGSVMVAPFPQAREFVYDEESINQMEVIKGVITGIRNIRGEMNVAPKTYVRAVIDVSGEGEKATLDTGRPYIMSLTKVESIEIVSEEKKPEGSATYVFGDIQVHVLLKGLIDYEKERKRIYKEIKRAEREMELSQRKLSNKDFLNQAPPNIIRDVREKSQLMSAKLQGLNQNLTFLEELK
jgi:valyl-tRNA synthetase